MKKTYIRPAATTVHFEPLQMLAASSIDYSKNEGTADQWSQDKDFGGWSSENWNSADE